CWGETQAITGISLESLSGSYSDVLRRVHPDDRPRLERAARDAVAGGSELQVEMRIVLRPTRRVRWVVASGIVERDQTGHAVRLLGVAQDITEQKEAEAARHAQAQGERLRALG